MDFMKKNSFQAGLLKYLTLGTYWIKPSEYSLFIPDSGLMNKLQRNYKLLYFNWF